MTDYTILANDRERLLDIFKEEAAVFEKLNPAEHWMSEAAASVYLGLKLRTLQELRRTGRGPKWAGARKRYRYRRADLAQWLQSQAA